MAMASWIRVEFLRNIPHGQAKRHPDGSGREGAQGKFAFLLQDSPVPDEGSDMPSIPDCPFSRPTREDS